MRVGLDTFTIRELNLTPLQTLDYLVEHEFEGAQFGSMESLSPSLDPGELQEIRSRADELGLYTYVSVSSPNPLLAPEGYDACISRISHEVRLAAEIGWHELHSSLGNDRTRFTHEIPWTEHLNQSTRVIKDLGPVLREHGSRINLEDHGDTTTFDLQHIIEDAGPDIAGVCLDTANVLCMAEDPVAAARRVAPYTHLTHTKDAIVFFCDQGIRRQGRPPGEGILDWEQIIPILAEYSPDLPLSIEDHKWMFDARIFDPVWMESVAEVPREDIVEVVRLAWYCQRKIDTREWPAPDEYEAIPYLSEMDARLNKGRDYLKQLL
ncbi:MAG: sugar phosphate isomerase/epimerase family protein [Armatimonadota bacterium]